MLLSPETLIGQIKNIPLPPNQYVVVTNLSLLLRYNMLLSINEST